VARGSVANGSRAVQPSGTGSNEVLVATVLSLLTPHALPPAIVPFLPVIHMVMVLCRASLVASIGDSSTALLLEAVSKLVSPAIAVPPPQPSAATSAVVAHAVEAKRADGGDSGSSASSNSRKRRNRKHKIVPITTPTKSQQQESKQASTEEDQKIEVIAPKHPIQHCKNTLHKIVVKAWNNRPKSNHIISDEPQVHSFLAQMWTDTLVKHKHDHPQNTLTDVNILSLLPPIVKHYYPTHSTLIQLYTIDRLRQAHKALGLSLPSLMPYLPS